MSPPKLTTMGEVDELSQSSASQGRTETFSEPRSLGLSPQKIDRRVSFGWTDSPLIKEFETLRETLSELAKARVLTPPEEEESGEIPLAIDERRLLCDKEQAIEQCTFVMKKVSEIIEVRERELARTIEGLKEYQKLGSVGSIKTQLDQKDREIEDLTKKVILSDAIGKSQATPLLSDLNGTPAMFKRDDQRSLNKVIEAHMKNFRAKANNTKQACGSIKADNMIEELEDMH